MNNSSIRAAWIVDSLAMGGVTTYVLNYARWLSARGVESQIFSFGSPTPQTAEQFHIPGVALQKAPPPHLIWEDKAAFILKQIEQLNPHVLIAGNGEYSFEFLRYAAPQVTRIGIVHVDSPAGYNYVPDYAANLDVLISVSKNLKDRLSSNPFLQHIRHEWIPGGILTSDDQANRTFPLHTGELSVLYAGRLENIQKRVHLLPEIARQVRAAGIPVRFTVAGEGTARAELQEAADSASLKGFFTLLPAQTPDQIKRLMLSHDVFLLPSAFEGLPMALIEAMSCRMAVVVSDLPSGIWEIVDRQSAMIAPILGPEGYAEAIIRLWKEPDLGGQLGELAREAFLKGFSLEVLGPKWFELLRIEERKASTEIKWPIQVKIRQPLFIPDLLHHPALRSVRRLFAALTRRTIRSFIA